MKENLINILPIKKLLKENFHIPDYQRGYRWTKDEVKQLLVDIWEFKDKPNKVENEFYCLQPVVVTSRFNEEKKINQWEIIDGQQRLTTIYIILNYINNSVLKNASDIFTLEFATRTNSEDFLKNIDPKRKEENIDFHYISEAFVAIKEWFEGQSNPALVALQFYPVLLENTEVIWYEVNDGSDPVDIFTRLNIGKIPLTNAELIKALFLSRDNFNDSRTIQLKQYEIAGQWDRIEYALHDDEFWYFLNNEKPKTASRIEFLFDLMAINAPGKDEYRTYRFFNSKFNGISGIEREKMVIDVWNEITKLFLSIEEWYDDKTRILYHLIGYLIAVGESVSSIKKLSENCLKSDFINSLNDLIRKKVDFDISELNYEADWNELVRVLLLFNVITVLTNKKSNYKFPFNRFKGNGNAKFKWSLEHIHAQHSEGLTTNAQWISWLEAHRDSLVRINPVVYAKLIGEIERAIPVINDKLFKELSSRVLSAFKEDGQEDKMHGIRNMALLDKDSNSALNSSIFEVKRNIIIDRDFNGFFIPVCTKNVFMKYYSRPVKNLYFWSKEDRESYFNAISEILVAYLPKKVIIIQTEA